MFETTSEVEVVSNPTQASSNSLISNISNNNVPVVVDGAISALNEALVDAIDNHHHHNHILHTNGTAHINNMLSASYYYCTNLLDFKNHFNQNFNISGYSLMSTPSVITQSTPTTPPVTSNTMLVPSVVSPSSSSLPSNSSNSDLGLINVNIEQNEYEEYLNFKNFTNKSPNNTNSTHFINNISSSNNESNEILNFSNNDRSKTRTKLRNRLIKRAQLSSKRQNVTSLNKLKSILFKTYRNITGRNNRYRYSRNNSSYFNKSSSLSPTSPSSSSSSSSSSCSNSPELILTTNLSQNTPIQLIDNDGGTKKKSSFKLKTYKRFEKIRNKLLKCNMTELINEEEDDMIVEEGDKMGENMEGDLDIKYDGDEESDIIVHKECYNVESENITNQSDSSSESFTNMNHSSLITLQSKISVNSSHNYEIRTPSITQNENLQGNEELNSHTYQNSSQSTNNFSYDVEMLPQPQLQQYMLTDEDEINTNNDNIPSQNFTNPFSNNFIASPSQTQPPHHIDSAVIQQCQIKQDLLKLSYEKFKQFRLNEKLLQQTVLIRNAIKMLQYDIQFQQEQEQILLQQQQNQISLNIQQQHQNNIESSHNPCLGYDLNERCQIEVMHNAQNTNLTNQQVITTSNTPTPTSSNNNDASSYLNSPITTSNLITPLPSSPSPSTIISQSNISTDISSQYLTDNNNGQIKTNISPIITAAYENFDEFINNNILNLNQKGQNSIFYNESENITYGEQNRDNSRKNVDLGDESEEEEESEEEGGEDVESSDSENELDIEDDCGEVESVVEKNLINSTNNPFLTDNMKTNSEVTTNVESNQIDSKEITNFINLDESNFSNKNDGCGLMINDDHNISNVSTEISL